MDMVATRKEGTPGGTREGNPEGTTQDIAGEFQYPLVPRPLPENQREISIYLRFAFPASEIPFASSCNV